MKVGKLGASTDSTCERILAFGLEVVKLEAVGTLGAPVEAEVWGNR